MGSLAVTMLVVLVLVALNGLFVAAEFAIVGAPRVAIEQRAAKGNRRARLVAKVLADPMRTDRYIATAQLGITAASLGLGMYGEHQLAEWTYEHLAEAGAPSWLASHALASVVAIGLLTYLHIVLGEMIPKALALDRAERTVMWIAPLMRGFQLAFYPFILVLNGIGNGILRLFGVDRREGGIDQFRTPDELSYIIRESQAGGMLRQESARVVQELLEFGDLTAYEVMVPRVRVVGIPLGAMTDSLRRLITDKPHTRYPVYRETLDHVVGMVHVKDLLRWIPSGSPLDASLVRRVPFIPETAIMDDVLAVMNQSRSQMAIVMDEHGGTAGIITVEDLFEEVVGEISDDASEQPEIYRDSEGRLLVAGEARIEDVGDALGVVLESEDFDRVSGLVLSLVGRPPEVGDVVVYDDVRFEVTAVAGHGVDECIASLVPRPEQEEGESVEETG